MAYLVGTSTIYQWREQIEEQSMQQKFRSIVFLIGDMSWALEWLSEAELQWKSWSETTIGRIFSEHHEVSSQLNTVVTGKTYRHHLGTENQKIAFFDSNFNVDAFAALSGTLAAGGVFYCWLPTEIDKQSTFVKQLLDVAVNNDDIYLVEENKDLPLISNIVSETKQATELPTEGQTEAISSIVKIANGRANSAFVLTADRGRGKTTALALASLRLLKNTEQPLDIIITAPHRMAVNVFFQHIKRQLCDAKVNGNLLTWQQHTVQFVPVDQLIKTKLEAKLLLIDEAAGIPVYLLEKLTSHYPRIVFSSTIHGYEGAGKGFTHKFLPILQKGKKQISQLHLTQPIRWENGDPLEQFIFESCMLNAEYEAIDDSLCISQQQLTISKYTGQQLAENKVLLTSVFSILVTAHYQTKPSDLKLLLDDESIRIVVAKFNKQVVAVALLNLEKEIEAELKSLVFSGQRRIKGHLIAQSLAQQSLHLSALNYQYLRVMRIAVHPQLQAQGLGSLLLTHIQQLAVNEHVDFVATSFAASTQVVNFWYQNNFKPVKLGFTKDASSGEHSLIMLHPINKDAEDFTQRIQHEFYQQFIFWLQDEFSELSYALVMQMLLMLVDQEAVLSDRDLEKINAFKNNANLFSVARSSIAKWLLVVLADQSSQVNKDLKPLVSRCLMLHSEQEICHCFGFSGKKALYQHFQQTLTTNMS